MRSKDEPKCGLSEGLWRSRGISHGGALAARGGGMKKLTWRSSVGAWKFNWAVGKLHRSSGVLTLHTIEGWRLLEFESKAATLEKLRESSEHGR